MAVIGERLWIENGDGAATAHRVIVAGPNRNAVIDGRSCRATPVRLLDPPHDHRLVRANEIALAAPLDPADQAEYARLDAALAGTIGDADRLVRFNALRLRSLLYGTVGA